MGETFAAKAAISSICDAFSILERIDVGETPGAGVDAGGYTPFSILERIDVGETTCSWRRTSLRSSRLSVSSNGSTWVKPRQQVSARPLPIHFQYPRTDRRG